MVAAGGPTLRQIWRNLRGLRARRTFGIILQPNTTTLDVRAILEGFREADLEPVHIRCGLGAMETEFRIRPVKLHTETIRVPREVCVDVQERPAASKRERRDYRGTIRAGYQCRQRGDLDHYLVGRGDGLVLVRASSRGN